MEILTKEEPDMRKVGSLFLFFVVFSLWTVLAVAKDQTVYNSIPKPLPGNVASEGPEAYAFAELGDGLALTVTSGSFRKVQFVMSSWACQQGNWYSGNCVTKPGATFEQPLTVSVYSVDDTAFPPTVVSLLGTITRTYDIPYRPTSTPSQCGGDATRWYSEKDKTCYHGVAVTEDVDFHKQEISVPSNGMIVLTVAFNTTHYGYHPIGESATCYGSSAGCPYDSLNISTDTTDGVFQFVGLPLDPNGIFVNYTLPNNSCTGSIQTGTLVDDTAPGCWVGFHPEFQVNADSHEVKQVSKGDNR
jgi:hypothetical protein